MKKNIPILLCFFLLISACSTKTAEPATLTIMTHDSFSISEELVKQFETENNVKLEFLPSGDTGSALNRAILTKKSPQADVFYGVDNTFLSRALDEEIFEPYDSPLLDNIPDQFKLDSENRALPVDYGDVCINFDKAWFAEKNLAVPQSFEDLLKPEYGNDKGDGLLVVENPATSSPGLAFLFATIAEYGTENYLSYWQQLKDNGVVVVNDWSTAYYTNFSGSSGKGPQPMTVSYASSPAVEVIYAESPVSEAPTASITGTNMCFRQIEFVGVLQGTTKKELAHKFIDFILSKEFQEDIPLQMFVYPVNPQAVLPEEFVKYNQVPEAPATLDPDAISENRETWIQDWSEIVLK